MNSKKIFIGLLVLVVILFVGKNLYGAKKNEWKAVRKSVTILDIDPVLSSDGQSHGIFMEYENDDNTTSGWYWLWSKQWFDNWPVRNMRGTFYRRKNTKNNQYDYEYKFIEEKPKKPKKVKPKKEEKVEPIIIEIPVELEWYQSYSKLPPIDRTVLVRYENGTTLTTAYMNGRNKWKLETDRDLLSGGKEITTIKEWRFIPE
jgi:hypothetical protein